ncbi:MAG: 5,6-dimethylbenzimidazole synthase [Candidatus Pelagadaptatus aseana]|uniref:5,6-dimethylbenzimidazole synthase n=1 Tax=Candidatus Pelagadaptatus aseana TaxID=3120508 RepID=UPI0039B12F98
MSDKPFESDFTQAEIDALYKTIFNRRDVRGQFTSEPVSDEVLSRLLYAAHHAPSVGFMQPWNFMVIRSDEVKSRVHDAFEAANEEARQMFEGERRELYSSLKLQGILDAPVNICITCDRERVKGPVLGRTHIKTMDLFSTVCAVQNLWLAARAEGIGMGWVSIVEQDRLRQALAIPDDIVPIAYLCVGHVSHFNDEPELQKKGWRSRLPLADLVYFDQWQQGPGEDEGLLEQLQKNQGFPEGFIKLP